jgi:hypothetical protein
MQLERRWQYLQFPTLTTKKRHAQEDLSGWLKRSKS